MKIKQLLEARGLLRKKLDDMLTNAGNETRGLNKEERASFDKIESEMSDLDETIARMRASEKDSPVVEMVAEEQRQAKPQEDSMVGPVLTENECRRYNLANVLRHLANPNDRDLAEKVQFEIEVSKRTNQFYNTTSEGIRVPVEVLARSMSSAAGQGGEFISTENRVDMFVELLRAKSPFIKRATVLSGLNGNVDIPRQLSGSTAYWLNEDEATTESSATFDQLELTPKTVSAHSYATRRLLMQSDMVVENFIENDLYAALAQEIDRVCAYGDGNKKPTGILSTVGIASVEMGTDGGAITYKKIVDIETEVANADADFGSMAYITNPKVRGAAKTTEVATGSGKFITDGKEMNGYPLDVSTKVISNGTKGSSNGVCSDLLFGDFSDMIVGFWGSVDIKADPFTQMDKGGIRFVAMQEVDVIIRNPAKFAVIRDITTA